MDKDTDIIAAKFLGKKVEGAESYDPTFLVAVPREENRLCYGIKKTALPFDGDDIWHAYEFSVLTNKGLPITRVLKLKYNCKNDFIVESKSLKLYLNSFNMTKIGNNTDECLNICKKTIEKDLCNLLKTDVKINFLNNNTIQKKIFDKFEDILNFIDEKDIEITQFKESPEVLNTETTNTPKEYYLKFDSLRSNCRVTHQPDFGDVFIYYKSKQHIRENSLVKYLCSFRSEYHFHEECCEMIYKRLYDLLDKNEDELFVCALYTRRGGIDISPIRYSKNCKIKDANTLANLEEFARCGIKQ